MSAALKYEPLISVDDYLEGEKVSEVRHEYLGGKVYAMAGATADHNYISLNIASALHRHLRGKPCRVFNHDMKVKLWAQVQLFYYPDVLVTCDPKDNDPYFRSRPKVIVEVISESTRGTDEREKLITFLQLPSMEEYVLVEQDKMKVTVFRREVDFVPEILEGREAVMHLRSLDFSLPLTEVYEGTAVSAA